MELSSRQRVLHALGGKQPDTVPIFDFIYSKKLYKEVLGKEVDSYNAEDVFYCSMKIGYDLIPISFGGVAGFRNPDAADDTYQDEWGTTYKKDQKSWPIDAPVGYPLSNREDWKNFRVPDPQKSGRLKQIQTALRLAKAPDMAIAGIVRGPFSATWLLFGMEAFCSLLYDDPPLIHDALTEITDFFIAGGMRMIEAGIHALFIADDYGSSTAPLISPPHFAEFVLPQLTRMASSFRKSGVAVILHSDGHIAPLLDLITATGISALHPLERNAGMSIETVKRNHGKQLCLLGNVNNTTTLVSGTASEVENEVLECLKAAAGGGGYILASDHSIKDDIPNKNVFALYDAGRRWGKYPLSLPNT